MCFGIVVPGSSLRKCRETTAGTRRYTNCARGVPSPIHQTPSTTQLSASNSTSVPAYMSSENVVPRSKECVDGCHVISKREAPDCDELSTLPSREVVVRP